MSTCRSLGNWWMSIVSCVQIAIDSDAQLGDFAANDDWLPQSINIYLHSCCCYASFGIRSSSPFRNPNLNALVRCPSAFRWRNLAQRDPDDILQSICGDDCHVLSHTCPCGKILCRWQDLVLFRLSSSGAYLYMKKYFKNPRRSSKRSLRDHCTDPSARILCGSSWSPPCGVLAWSSTVPCAKLLSGSWWHFR